MTTAPTTFTLERPRDGVALVTLDRPGRLNAMSRTMFAELRALTEELTDDTDVRVVVLTGAGGAFCAGYDIDAATEFGELDPSAAMALQDAGVRAVHGVHTLPQPVIAAVDGPAVGGGFSLALAADMRVVGPRARLQAIFVRLGLSGGDMGASWLLPRIVGRGLAAELLYSGRPVGAEEAVRTGLANRAAASSEGLLDEAMALAGEIADRPRLGVVLTKRSLRASTDAPSLASALENEARAQAFLFSEPSVHEAVARLRADRERR